MKDMNDKQRDQLEDIFRSKLQNFESDPDPADLDAILQRLPARKVVPLKRKWQYVAAAAAVVFLIATGTFYFYTEETLQSPLVQQARQETEVLDNQLKQEQLKTITEPVQLADGESVQEKKDRTYANKKVDRIVRLNAAVQSASQKVSTVETETDSVATEVPNNTEGVPSQPSIAAKQDSEPKPVAEKAPETRRLIADAGQPDIKRGEKTDRKWSFGLGSGSFTAGSGNTINTYTFKNSMQADKGLMYMNAASINSELPKTDIHHDTPITFGLAVSRRLNDRFALQTGLNFTLLSSDWKTNGTFHTKTKQKLYFLGVPMSVVYKIAEWNNFQFYTSAGAMAEINVNGIVKNTLFSEGIDLGTESEKVRMKEWLWSANAKAGVSYPVYRFVNVFVEGGVAYYFDNGSSIETIRSEKPFNAGFNVGLRLGF